MTSTFNFIKKQLLSLVKEGKTEGRVYFKHYPMNEMMYLIRSGVLKIDPETMDGKSIVIHSLDYGSDFMNRFGESEKAEREGKISRIKKMWDNLPLVQRTMLENDKLRHLEFSNFTAKEKLTREDSCVFGMFVRAKGFDSVEELNSMNFSVEEQELLDMEYTKFLTGQFLTQDYEDGKRIDFSYEGIVES